MKDRLIHNTGFGLIKRNVMRSKDISLQSKAIYSYLVSFAGIGMEAYPSQELMCEELDISINSLRKYIKELKDKGLIIITQSKSKNGSFMHNRYTLTDYVVDTQNLVDAGTQNLTPNNNSSNNNSSNNIYIVDEPEDDESDLAKEIIEHLNDKTGCEYKYKSKKTKDCINARMREGYELTDFKTVIDTKVSQWLNDSRMKKYLRPETLFSNKFESYLNESKIKNEGVPNDYDTSGKFGTYF